MDLVKKYDICAALSRLKKRYPVAFQSPETKLEDFIPSYDPDMVAIRAMRNEVKLNDRNYNMDSRSHWRTAECRLQVAQGVKDHLRVNTIAIHAKTSARKVKEIIKNDKKMRGAYEAYAGVLD